MPTKVSGIKFRLIILEPPSCSPGVTTDQGCFWKCKVPGLLGALCQETKEVASREGADRVQETEGQDLEDVGEGQEGGQRARAPELGSEKARPSQELRFQSGGNT